MFALTGGHALIDLDEPRLELGTQCGQGFFNGRQQNGLSDFCKHSVFVRPAGIADQVVFKLAEFIAVVDVQVPGLQCVAQQPVDQKFVAIDIENLVLRPALTRNKTFLLC